MFERIKKMLKKWLGIKPAENRIVLDLTKGLTFEQTVMRNRLWYIGDPALLSQFYKKLSGDPTNDARFWAVVPDEENYIRKIHSDIPQKAVDKLVDIVMGDLEDIAVSATEGGESNEDWAEIASENAVTDLLAEALIDILICGDGAFKLIIDTQESEYPIIQWVPGDRVDFVYKYNRLNEVKFYSEYFLKDKKFTLVETYGKGSIVHELMDEKGTPVPLATIDGLSELNNIFFNTDTIFAIPAKFKLSKDYKNRGAGIFEGKSDLFDALDESISQWVDALRAGRTNTYIPDCLLPDNGGKKNPIKTRYTTVETDGRENAKNEVKTTQGDIRAQDYLTTHISLLDSCLQGIISPSTLGIDVKKLDNAEAQREKEKTTLYMRDRLIELLNDFVKRLITTTLNLNNVIRGIKEEEYFIDLQFGEYASPSFEATVETMAKAAPGKQLLSFDKIVAELWGKDMTEKEQKAEVLRLQALNNPAQSSEYVPGFKMPAEFNITEGENNGTG